jgi:hypothetical protein
MMLPLLSIFPFDELTRIIASEPYLTAKKQLKDDCQLKDGGVRFSTHESVLTRKVFKKISEVVS